MVHSNRSSIRFFGFKTNRTEPKYPVSVVPYREWGPAPMFTHIWTTFIRGRKTRKTKMRPDQTEEYDGPVILVQPLEWSFTLGNRTFIYLDTTHGKREERHSSRETVEESVNGGEKVLSGSYFATVITKLPSYSKFLDFLILAALTWVHGCLRYVALTVNDELWLCSFGAK